MRVTSGSPSDTTTDKSVICDSEAEHAFRKMHEETLRLSEMKGEEDGKRNLPQVAELTMPPFERELLNKYQGEVHRLYGKGRQLLDDLYDKQYKPTKDELERLERNPDEIPTLIRQAEEERDRRLKELAINYENRIKDIHNDAGWDTSQKDFRYAENQFRNMTDKHGRTELHIQFNPILASLLLLAIGICEIPLNYQVFVSFREAPILTLIMSGVLVLALPFLAHGSGKLLKQGHERKVYYVLLSISVLLVFVLSYYTALLRRHYLASKGIPEMELSTDFTTFFVIGIVLYFVGLIASYFSHDDSIEFSEVYKMFQRANVRFKEKQSSVNQKVSEEKLKYSESTKNIQDEFSTLKGDLQRRISVLRDKLIQSAGTYDQVLNYFKGFESQVNQCCQEAINSYRGKNWEYRDNHAQPKYWADVLRELEYRFDSLAELTANPGQNRGRRQADA